MLLCFSRKNVVLQNQNLIMNQGKIDEQIKKNLFSANTDVVISALEAIQKKGQQTLSSYTFRFAEFISGTGN